MRNNTGGKTNEFFKKLVSYILVATMMSMVLTSCGGSGGGSAVTSNDVTELQLRIAAVNAKCDELGVERMIENDQLEKWAEELAEISVKNYNNGLYDGLTREEQGAEAEKIVAKYKKSIKINGKSIDISNGTGEWGYYIVTSEHKTHGVYDGVVMEVSGQYGQYMGNAVIKVGDNKFCYGYVVVILDE